MGALVQRFLQAHARHNSALATDSGQKIGYKNVRSNGRRLQGLKATGLPVTK